jgi:hypothetical protein
MLRQLLQPFTHHFQALKSKVMRWNKRGQRFQGVTKPPPVSNVTVLPPVAALSVAKYTPVVLSDEELASQNLPTYWPINVGGTLDISQYVTGGVPPNTITLTGTLPADWLFNDPILTAPEGATAGLTTEQFGFDVTDSATSGALSVNFGLLSTVGGPNLPFTYGHVFKEGEVPSGSYVTSDLTNNFQAIPITSWPDGSLRQAIIAGRATCTAGVEKVIALSATTTAPTGVALTTANLASVLSGVSLDLPDLQDWTFDTGAQTVGALLAMSSSLDEYGTASAVTVNNSASSGSLAASQSGSSYVLTASISGGTANAFQTVTHTLHYHRVRAISAITKAANARITYTGASMAFAVGNTVTFNSVGGMSELNSLTGTITAVSNVTNGWFEVNIDSTGFTTFTSGGTAKRVQTSSIASAIGAFVRAGGGIEWNGTTNVIKATNSLPDGSVSITNFSSPFKIVCSGPVMSNWIYRVPVPGSSHLVLWLDIRLYEGGVYEVFPWIENAMFLTAAPRSHRGTFTLTIGGTEVYSALLDVRHHTRPALLNGALSYWSSDPGITPVHDADYNIATKMFPNFGWRNPDSATLNALPQSYAPNTLAGISTNMGVAGTSASIISLPGALYITSSDARAWKAGITFAMSGGSWSIHYRDETGELHEPFSFTSYPNASINTQVSPTVPVGGTTVGVDTNGTAAVSHQYEYGYMAWLMTGRWWFLDEMLFWASHNYLRQTVGNRFGSDGVIRSTVGQVTDRGSAWGRRVVAQTLVCLPEDHFRFAEIKNSWEKNTAWYYDIAIGGTLDSGVWQNDLGVLGQYEVTGVPFDEHDYGYANDSVVYYGAGWMQHMIQMVLGFTWDLKLPQSGASETLHEAVRDHGYTMVVMKGGDGLGGNWSYRNFNTYVLNWGDVGGTYYPSWNGAWELYKGRYGHVISDVEDGLSLLHHGETLRDLEPGEDTVVVYFGMALGTLAYAVDHGKTGAAAAWARVTGASNYDEIVAAGFHNDPVYGFLPRTL